MGLMKEVSRRFETLGAVLALAVKAASENRDLPPSMLKPTQQAGRNSEKPVELATGKKK